jgi:hypothetical protein
VDPGRGAEGEKRHPEIRAQMHAVKAPYWICFFAIGALAPLLAWLLWPLSGFRPRKWALGLLGALCLLVFSRFAWWNTGFDQTPWGWLVFVASLYGLLGALSDEPTRSECPQRWDLRDAFSLAVLAVFSLRSDALFGPSAMHHWSAYVGPAELARQGARLLWDVPSQYGLLSIWTLATLPFQSAWNALFALNAALILACSVVVYVFLRELFPGRWSRAFALLLTLATVQLLPGWPSTLEGIAAYPSSGPLRFWPVYFLLACVRSRRWLLGLCLWAVALLWSLESALYASSVWVPAFVLHAWQDCPPGRQRRLRLALPSALGIAWLLFLAVHSRWHGFTEYALAFGSTFGGQRPDPWGAVWAELLHLSLLAAGLVGAWRAGDARLRPLLVAAWMAAWCPTSYFLGNIHDNNLLNVLAMSLPAVTLAMRDAVLRVAYAALFAVLLTCAYGKNRAWAERLQAAIHGSSLEMSSRRMAPPQELLELLARERVDRDQPLVSWDESYGYSLVTGNPAWLPVQSYPLLRPLRPEAFRRYTERFWAHLPREGWLLVPRTPADAAHLRELIQVIEETHDKVSEAMSPRFRLTRYAWRGPVSP